MKTVTFDETKWKLVPIEPTRAMFEATVGCAGRISLGNMDAHIPIAWHAMLAAAPQPPAPAKPLPLTEEIIASFADEWLGSRTADSIAPNRLIGFARVIEAAHNIKEPT